MKNISQCGISIQCQKCVSVNDGGQKQGAQMGGGALNTCLECYHVIKAQLALSDYVGYHMIRLHCISHDQSSVGFE